MVRVKGRGQLGRGRGYGYVGVAKAKEAWSVNGGVVGGWWAWFDGVNGCGQRERRRGYGYVGVAKGSGGVVREWRRGRGGGRGLRG